MLFAATILKTCSFWCFKMRFVFVVRGETITKADIRLSDIARLLGPDWVLLAQQLDISNKQIDDIKEEYPDDNEAQALNMLHLWFVQRKDQATGANSCSLV